MGIIWEPYWDPWGPCGTLGDPIGPILGILGILLFSMILLDNSTLARPKATCWTNHTLGWRAVTDLCGELAVAKASLTPLEL